MKYRWYPGRYIFDVVERVVDYVLGKVGFESVRVQKVEKSEEEIAKEIYNKVWGILYQYVYKGVLSERILERFDSVIKGFDWICKSVGLEPPCSVKQVAQAVAHIFGVLKSYLPKDKYETVIAPIYKEIYKVFEEYGYGHLLPAPGIRFEIDISLIKKIIEEARAPLVNLQGEVKDHEIEAARKIFEELKHVLEPPEIEALEDYIRKICRFLGVPFPGTPQTIEKALTWLMEWQRAYLSEEKWEAKWKPRVEKIKEIFRKYAGYVPAILLHIELPFEEKVIAHLLPSLR